jgi:hypothetical protein
MSNSSADFKIDALVHVLTADMPPIDNPRHGARAVFLAGSDAAIWPRSML